MKITFPHLGDAHLLARLFFNEIGVPFISSPLNSEKTLQLGIPISPSEICLPFKLMIGNLIMAFDREADTVVMPATMGPCRLGEYAELFKNILEKRNIKMDWILLDSTNAIGNKELLRRLNLLIEDRTCSISKVMISLISTYNVLTMLEKLEKKAHVLCGYERTGGNCKNILKKCRRNLKRAGSLKRAQMIMRVGLNELKNIKIDKNKKPVKILLTGEIYSLIEPFSNNNIEEMLMDRGVSFKKNITIGWWIRANILNPFYVKWHHYKKNKYMPYGIGGYAKETVEEGMRCKAQRYDGVVQLLPVGCMPEIVAKSVLEFISKQEGVKVLTVILDEMNGDAGLVTRIEAFIDMLAFNKRKEQKHVLYGGRCGIRKHRHRIHG